MTFVPSTEILEKYARLLVSYWLGENWVQAWEVVLVRLPEIAKPFLLPLQKAILEVGAHPLFHFIPDGTARLFFEQANDDQLNYIPQQYLMWRLADIDHEIAIIADVDKYELEGIDPQKIMSRQSSMMEYIWARRKKEAEGKYSWTVALYGTEAMAKEVHMSPEEYRNEIIHACYLDRPNPTQVWKDLQQKIIQVKNYLNWLPIEWLHIKGADIDLKVQIGKERIWLGGTGRNIPSFEVFISPDYRGTEGWAKFNQPLYRYGNLVTWIELKFSEGKVVDARASQNENVLKEMIATENADRVGEFSLTDKRFSRIQKFMWETLYDENVWGPYGNTHIALWNAYRESYPGDRSSVNEQEWVAMGYNTSVVHTDIVSTSDRTVIAHLANGEQEIIYQNGMFTFLHDA